MAPHSRPPRGTPAIGVFMKSSPDWLVITHWAWSAGLFCDRLQRDEEYWADLSLAPELLKRCIVGRLTKRAQLADISAWWTYHWRGEIYPSLLKDLFGIFFKHSCLFLKCYWFPYCYICLLSWEISGTVFTLKKYLRHNSFYITTVFTLHFSSRANLIA